jgi:protein O-GlcNAc transferase
MSQTNDAGTLPLLAQAQRCFDAGQFREAEQLCKKCLAANPRDAAALDLLGRLAHRGRRPDIALGLIKQSTEIRPENADAHLDLAEVLLTLNRSEEAARSAETAVKLAPRSARAHFTLGSVRLFRGEIEPAIAALNTALELDPNHADSHGNLANALLAQRREAEAMEHFRIAHVLQPSSPAAARNLGRALASDGQHDQAIDLLRRAVQMDPGDSVSLCHLGSAYKGVGLIQQALECYNRALTARLGHIVDGSGRLLLLNYVLGLTTEAILHEHKQWNLRHATPLRHLIKPHTNNRDPVRRLRIGYVSGDFHDHPVGRNILPLLSQRNREQFEVFCYFNSPLHDGFTDSLRAHADGWRQINATGDEQCAQVIRDDRIDILVDLSLQSGGNRLLVFAQKPAPVQVTFAGYPGGTGLEAMDWRLTDPYLDPPGQNDADYVERSWRLPNSFWCYDPAAMQWDPDGKDPPEVSPLPAIRSGYIRFGCLNTFAKVNDAVLKLWSQVLQRIPSSRLLLLAPAGQTRQRVLATFAQHGVDPSRIDFVARQPRRAYLAEFAQFDIGLDTVPYNGHTTSLDSLWMGVPVITRLGSTIVGRAGWSQLSNLQLTELAAEDDEQFVNIAVEMAADTNQLAELRRSLRDRMLASPLTDARRFAQNVESAYRQMWRQWTGGQGAKEKPPPNDGDLKVSTE